MVTTATINNGASSPAAAADNPRTPYKKKARNSKVPKRGLQKRKKLLLVYIELLMRSICNSAEKTPSPIIQLKRKVEKPTMPSSRPLYRTLHPINIRCESSMRSMGKVGSVESVACALSTIFLTFASFGDTRRETGDRTPETRCTPQHASNPLQ